MIFIHHMTQASTARAEAATTAPATTASSARPLPNIRASYKFLKRAGVPWGDTEALLSAAHRGSRAAAIRTLALLAVAKALESAT